MARIPNIFEQVFETGDAMTGVAYTGEGVEGFPADPDTGFLAGNQSPDGHRIRQAKSGAEGGAIDGGLIPIQGYDINPDGTLAYKYACEGYRKLVSIYVFAHTATLINVILVDTDGFEHLIRTATTESLVDDLLSDSFLLPGWKLKVTANAIGANGAKVVAAFDTWFNAAPFPLSQI